MRTAAPVLALIGAVKDPKVFDGKVSRVCVPLLEASVSSRPSKDTVPKAVSSTLPAPLASVFVSLE